jgi:hypothetical protein
MQRGRKAGHDPAGPRGPLSGQRHNSAIKKCGVDSEKIIPDRPNRDHMRVVFQFLAERIRQPSEAAIVHPLVRLERSE